VSSASILIDRKKMTPVPGGYLVQGPRDEDQFFLPDAEGDRCHHQIQELLTILEVQKLGRPKALLKKLNDAPDILSETLDRLGITGSRLAELLTDFGTLDQLTFALAEGQRVLDRLPSRVKERVIHPRRGLSLFRRSS
jgi:hypothetical protein